MANHRDYISRQGYNDLKAEWADLKQVQRPEMQKQVQVAAAEGDRSENAAYTYGKMRLREIDRRLRYLDKIIDKAVVVDEIADTSKIRFGATVKLLNLDNQKQSTYTLVGQNEMDVMQGKISISSPLGKVLIGKETGNTLVFQTPRGPQNLSIQSVEY